MNGIGNYVYDKELGILIDKKLKAKLNENNLESCKDKECNETQKEKTEINSQKKN